MFSTSTSNPRFIPSIVVSVRRPSETCIFQGSTRKRRRRYSCTYTSLGADGGKKRYLYYVVSAISSILFVGCWNNGDREKNVTNTAERIQEWIQNPYTTYKDTTTSVVHDNDAGNRAILRELYQKFARLLILPPCFFAGSTFFKQRGGQPLRGR